MDIKKIATKVVSNSAPAKSETKQTVNTQATRVFKDAINKSNSATNLFEKNKSDNFYLNNKNSANKNNSMVSRHLTQDDNDILEALNNEVKLLKNKKTLGTEELKSRISRMYPDLIDYDINSEIAKWVETQECDASIKFGSLLGEGGKEGVPLATRIKNALVGGDPEVKTSNKTENEDGTVTETIEYEDGTTSVKIINADGSYTEKGCCTDGETWEKIVNTDGSYTKTRMMPDGSICKVIVNKDGNIHAETTAPNGYTSTQDLNGDNYTEEVKYPDGSFYRLVVNTSNGRWIRTGGKAVGPFNGGILYEPYECWGDDFGGYPASGEDKE